METKTTTLSSRELNCFLLALEMRGYTEGSMYTQMKSLLDSMIVKKKQEVTVFDEPFTQDIKRIADLYTEMKKEQRR